MKLIDVYTEPRAADLLWALLAERPAAANISHRKMPSYDEHMAFIASQPYAHWYLIDVGAEDYAGAIYLTPAREIGIGIFKRYWGFGHGKMAIQLLRAKHPGRMLANVAPRNFVSQTMFMDLGFKLLSHTYELQEATP